MEQTARARWVRCTNKEQSTGALAVDHRAMAGLWPCCGRDPLASVRVLESASQSVARGGTSIRSRVSVSDSRE